MRLKTAAAFAALLSLGLAGCVKKTGKSALQAGDGTQVPFKAVVKYQSGQMQVTFTPPAEMAARQFALKSIEIKAVTGTGGAGQVTTQPTVGALKFVSDATATQTAVTCDSLGGALNAEVGGTCTTGASTQAIADFAKACTESKGTLEKQETCICKPTGAELRLQLADYVKKADGALETDRFVNDCKNGASLTCAVGGASATEAQQALLSSEFAKVCRDHDRGNPDMTPGLCYCDDQSVNMGSTIACSATTLKFAIDQTKFNLSSNCPYKQGSGGFCKGKTAPSVSDYTADAKKEFAAKCSSFGDATLSPDGVSCSCNASKTQSSGIEKTLTCDDSLKGWKFDPASFAKSPCVESAGTGPFDCKKPPTAEQNTKFSADVKATCGSLDGTIVGTDGSCLCNAGGVQTITVEDIRSCDAQKGYSVDLNYATWVGLKSDFKACPVKGQSSGGGAGSGSGGKPPGGGGSGSTTPGASFGKVTASKAESGEVLYKFEAAAGSKFVWTVSNSAVKTTATHSQSTIGVQPGAVFVQDSTLSITLDGSPMEGYDHATCTIVMHVETAAVEKQLGSAECKIGSN